MKEIAAALLALSVTISAAHAADSWRAHSSPGATKGTIRTDLAGWRLVHFPDNEAKFLMVGTETRPVVFITDYPDSVEIRAVNGPDFITVRDKDHDSLYEEIEGLSNGTILKLESGAYKLSKADGQWSLTRLP